MLPQPDKRVQKLLKANQVLAKFAEVFVHAQQPLKVLDLSCGPRLDVRQVVQHFGHQWVGVDIVGYPGVIQADAHHLPFADAEFDVVYSAVGFEYYRDPWQAMREVNRVLKPGGYFLASIAFLTPCHGSYFHMTHQGISALLEQNGIAVLQLHPSQEQGVPYLIRKLFDRVPGLGGALAPIGTLLVGLHRLLNWGAVAAIHLKCRNDAKVKKTKLDHVKEQALYWSALIIVQGRKEHPLGS